nr:elongation factor 1-beta isoform X1 [Aotus nancymaae]
MAASANSVSRFWRTESPEGLESSHSTSLSAISVSRPEGGAEVGPAGRREGQLGPAVPPEVACNPRGRACLVISGASRGGSRYLPEPWSSRILADVMGFGDLKSPAGLQVLNDYLADKSYIEGYVPSQADVAVFEAVSGPPPADLCHALRWYNHIKSYEKEKASLPGVKKALGKYGPVDVEDTTGSGATDSKDDDDIDLFGSDDEEESEEAKRLREERLAQYESKKAKKPALVAKSSILLDVKPWDDETDMAKLEECVRSIQADGLVWGSSKLVPVGYGIKKLQIQCVVEDDKVGTDMLEEQITAFEDYVQSMDVAAFNKI